MKRRYLLFGVLLPLLLSACALDSNARKQASSHFQMGQVHLAENDPTRALIELTAAEKLTPEDPDVLLNLGYAYFLKKRYDLAEAKYLRAIELKPDYSLARYYLGVNYIEMQRWDAAVTQFTVVLADLFFLNHEDTRIKLGLAYLGKGDHSQALANLRQSVSANPRNANARIGLGRVYFAMEKNDLAIQEFRKAVELSRTFPDGHYFLALAYLKGKDYVAAADAFREVIRIAPDSEKGRLSREHLESMK